MDSLVSGSLDAAGVGSVMPTRPMSSGSLVKTSCSSTRSLCAFFLPTPGTVAMRASSCVATTVARDAGVSVLRTASASFGPTPDTPTRRSNTARSSRLQKP